MELQAYLCRLVSIPKQEISLADSAQFFSSDREGGKNTTRGLFFRSNLKTCKSLCFRWKVSVSQLLIRAPARSSPLHRRRLTPTANSNLDLSSFHGLHARSRGATKGWLGVEGVNGYHVKLSLRVNLYIY